VIRPVLLATAAAGTAAWALLLRHREPARPRRGSAILDANGHPRWKCELDCGRAARREQRQQLDAALEASNPGYIRRRNGAYRKNHPDRARAMQRERHHLKAAEKAEAIGDQAGHARHMRAVWKARADLAATYETAPDWAAILLLEDE
jgi:hypothetical protein